MCVGLHLGSVYSGFSSFLRLSCLLISVEISYLISLNIRLAVKTKAFLVWTKLQSIVFLAFHRSTINSVCAILTWVGLAWSAGIAKGTVPNLQPMPATISRHPSQFQIVKSSLQIPPATNISVLSLQMTPFPRSQPSTALTPPHGWLMGIPNLSHRRYQPRSMNHASTAALNHKTQLPVALNPNLFKHSMTTILDDARIRPFMASDLPQVRTRSKSCFTQLPGPPWYLTLHYRQVKCEWAGCTYDGAFTRDMSLWRHIKAKHILPRRFKCHKCNRAFGRQDKLREHTGGAHSKSGLGEGHHCLHRWDWARRVFWGILMLGDYPPGWKAWQYWTHHMDALWVWRAFHLCYLLSAFGTDMGRTRLQAPASIYLGV